MFGNREISQSLIICVSTRLVSGGHNFSLVLTKKIKNNRLIENPEVASASKVAGNSKEAWVLLRTVKILKKDIEPGHFFFIPADGSFTHSYFHHSTAATSLQRQKPLKHVPTAKMTPRKQTVNQRLTKVCTKPCFLCKGTQNLIHTARHWNLFSFCFIDIFFTYLHATLGTF